MDQYRPPCGAHSWNPAAPLGLLGCTCGPPPLRWARLLSGIDLTALQTPLRGPLIVGDPGVQIEYPDA